MCVKKNHLELQIVFSLLNFPFRQQVYLHDGPCTEKMPTINVPAEIYDSMHGVDETIELANAGTNPPAVPESSYDIKPDVPADVYDSTSGVDERIELANDEKNLPAAPESSYEIIEPIEEVIYNPNAGGSEPIDVHDILHPMRASRRSFGKIKSKIEQGLKEIESKLRRTNLGSIGDTVGSSLSTPSTSLGLDSMSSAAKKSLEEFLQRIRAGKGNLAFGPNVATSIVQPVKLIEKVQPEKVPATVEPFKLIEDIGQAIPAIVQPTTQVESVGAPAIQPEKLLEEVGKAGPIVQPTSLIDDDEKPLPKNVTHELSKQQLLDVKDIRAEITYAVDHHKYAHSSDEIKKIYQSEHHHHHNHHNNGTHHSLQSPQKNAAKAHNSASSVVGSQHVEFSAVPEEITAEQLPAALPTPLSLLNATMAEIDRRNEELVEEMMAKKLAGDGRKEIIANVIESHAGVGAGAEPTFVNSDTREVLHIKAVTEDMRFTLGQTVVAWKTIQRNARDKHALVGLTATGVLLLAEKNGTYVVQAEVPMISPPSCMTTYTRWNHTQQTIEGIVVVATQSELVFLRVNEALDAMRFYWMVPMNEHTVSAVEYFTVNDAHLIVLVSADVDRPSANLYRFALDHREFYLRESLTLAVPAKTVAYLATGSEHFLTFPQRKTAVVYKYGHDRFKYFIEIDAENIETLETFEMGGNGYLALGGTRPRILRYHRGQFHDQTILAPSWGIVEHFLPIPARTYRDDMIVLIQHRIAFSTHNISVLEALIWNGEAFDPALSIPCIINERKSELGLGCMLDADREMGIHGATVFQRNNFITILSPRHDAPSGLFDLEFELKPSEYEYDEAMIDLFAEVLVLLEMREQQVSDARQTFVDFEMSRDEEIVVADRAFDTIVTNYAEWTGEIAPTTQLFYGSEPTDTETITSFILTVNAAQSSMPSEVPRPKRDDIESNVVRWESLDVLNLFVESINNVSAADFVFLRNKTLDLNGNLVLKQSLDFDDVQWRGAESQQTIPILPNQTPSEPREADNGEAGDIVTERLDVDGDFSFEEINGVVWLDLINEIVLKNQPQDLSELIVNGVSGSGDST